MTGTTPLAYKGIVVVGAPRSGTTLVRRLLNAHPRIACPPETGLFGACARFLHEDSFGDGLSVGVVPGLSFSGFEEESILERLRILAFEILDEIARRENKAIWAEKTAFDAFHLDGIERVCQEHVRYVCVFRHGLDVACSLGDLVQKMETYVTELHPYVSRYHRPLEAFAHAWVDVTRRMRQLIDARPQQCVELRYEDLIQEPAIVLSRVFAGLDLSTDVPGLLARAFKAREQPGLGDWKTYQLTAISTKSLGRWKRIRGESLARLARIVNPTLADNGYAIVESKAGGDAAESRRRMAISLLAARLKADDLDDNPPDNAE